MRARAASWSLALVFLMTALPAGARAQDVLSRADSADVLVGTAERMHVQGSDGLAEALARLVQRRYADTPAAVRASALLASMRETQRSSSGRVGLIAGSTIYGAWLGIALPLMFEAQEPEAYGIGLLAGAPLGFLAGRAFTRDRSLSAGDAGLITWSTAWGSWQGAGWMLVLGDSEVCDPGFGCYESDPEASDIVGAMVVGGLAGMGGSVLAANNSDITGGTATMIGFGSLWGTWYGVVVSVLADLLGDQSLAAVLIGGDAGLAAMAVLAPRWDMSTGRAWLVNAAGIMGGAIGGGLDLLIQPSDADIAILIPAVGSAVGLGLGAHLTRDHDAAPRLRDSRMQVPHGPERALLLLREGDWRVALPQPTPTLLRHGGPTRAPRHEPGVRVPLLDARF